MRKTPVDLLMPLKHLQKIAQLKDFLPFIATSKSFPGNSISRSFMINLGLVPVQQNDIFPACFWTLSSVKGSSRHTEQSGDVDQLTWSMLQLSAL
ncbi:hypothetical protein V6N13_144837 [Hibiscus sabdariffa]